MIRFPIISLILLTFAPAALAQGKPPLDCCKIPTRAGVGGRGSGVGEQGKKPNTQHLFGSPTPDPRPPTPGGMTWIPGGEFVMGAEDVEGRADERPRNRVRVSGFFMDVAPVTNAEFAKFVEATNYVTTAERKPDWDELKKGLPKNTPKPPDSELVTGSMVFTPPDHAVGLGDVSAWWQFVPGADWRHPEGAGSDLKGRENHPVVQISYADALAYATWAGKRLPTEAEWEFAARGGLKGKKYFWGNAPVSAQRANYWQGRFPDDNTGVDGYISTSPVKSYPPNGYGLYDMAGNVWQWCADWYRADLYRERAKSGKTAFNPIGPATPFDPDELGIPKRVTRGGSFLCNEAYCASYRVAARMKTSPDTSLGNLGFRCVMTLASSQKVAKSKP